MSFSKTKEQQYEIDRDLANYHGIDRDTPGGFAGQALRRAREASSYVLPPGYGNSHSNASTGTTKSDSGGMLWFILLLIIVIL